jgi:hypothetical protein
MTTVNVQFADATDETIVSFFGCPQDPAAWPNQGTVETSDPRWKTYFDAQPELVQTFLPEPEAAVSES